jgi:hypothetical protein
LIDHLLGASLATPDAREVRVKPQLHDLDYVRGSVPTRLGPIKVSLERGTAPQIKLPDGLSLK